MIIKFLAKSYTNGKTTGTNSIKSAIGYVLSNEDSQKTERIKEPEILKGNPKFVEHVGKNCEHQHKYTSLVLSFRKEENPTTEEQQKIIKHFESVAFSGLKEEEYTALWVKHEDKGRVEFHCITPRVHMPTGKSLNIRPPGNQSYELYTALRDVINADMGYKEVVEDKTKINPKLADYQHKKIAQGLVEEKGNFKNKLTNLLTKEIAIGSIKNRTELVENLKDWGFEVVRQGEDYISIKNPTEPASRNIRLKGGIYDKSSGAIGQHREEATKEASRYRTKTVDSDKPSIEQTREKLNRLVENRAQFNEKRFNPAERYTEKTSNSACSNLNRDVLSLDDSHKLMVELSNNRGMQETSKPGWIGFTQNKNRKPINNNQHRRASGEAIRKSNNNKEIEDEESGRQSRARDFGGKNTEIGAKAGNTSFSHEAIHGKAEPISNTDELILRSSSGTRNKGGTASLQSKACSDKAKVCTGQIIDWGDISALEQSLGSEFIALANAKTDKERLRVQNRINSLLSRIEIAKNKLLEKLSRPKKIKP